MIQHIRLATGLVLFGYVTFHLINHAFGLISVRAMADVAPYIMGIWRNQVMLPVVGTALAVHMVLSLAHLVARRSLRLSGWEWCQLLLGLAVPALLFQHLIGGEIIERVTPIDTDYPWLIWALWIGNPLNGVLQVLGLLAAWLHGCLGVHYWLRTKRGYDRWCGALMVAAVMLPTLALAGYVSAGFETLRLAQLPGYVESIAAASRITPESLARFETLTGYGAWMVVAVSGGPFVARIVWLYVLRLTRGPRVALPDGRMLRLTKGASLLETLRDHGVPIAAVCGGRGRCTTCRVRVLDGLDRLPRPEGVEAKALTSIAAPASLRLACQLHPLADLAVTPLLPPNATAADGRRPGGLEGRERRITCMFIDLRGSTRLGETKMPYDVLFILNQFFAEMTAALLATRGHYAQFTGDGLMALYGLNAPDANAGARDALRGATEMAARLDKLNGHLRSELVEPLRMGIGIHHGDAIVGTMGPPGRELLSAIGDTINIAARLENLSKECNKPLIVSRAAAQAAGVRIDAAPQTIPVRGRDRPVMFYALDQVPTPG